MREQSRTWITTAAIGLILLTMACVLPGVPQGLQPTATPTPGLAAGGSQGGSTGGSSGNQGGSQGGQSGNGGSQGGSDNGGPSSVDSGTATQLPDINTGPYTVKQIETLGGEAISGMVCSLTQPFSVLSVTPHVTFSFYFAPQDASHGKVSYAYSIKSAGESHNASGNYTTSLLDKSGTLQLSMTLSDHVVFKGFDGNMPIRYKFNLVPTPGVSCQPSR